MALICLEVMGIKVEAAGTSMGRPVSRGSRLYKLSSSTCSDMSSRLAFLLVPLLSLCLNKRRGNGSLGLSVSLFPLARTFLTFSAFSGLFSDFQHLRYQTHPTQQQRARIPVIRATEGMADIIAIPVVDPQKSRPCAGGLEESKKSRWDKFSMAIVEFSKGRCRTLLEPSNLMRQFLSTAIAPAAKSL